IYLVVLPICCSLLDSLARARSMRGNMHSPADAPPEPVRDFDWWRSRIGFVLGPLLAIVVLLMPMPSLSSEAHRLAAILALTIVYWMTEAIPMAATALLGPALCILLGVGEDKKVLAP